jgi:hypothetical protein
LGREKLAGRSEVTVVWATAPEAESVTVEINPASSEAARRCGGIMTYLKNPEQHCSG